VLTTSYNLHYQIGIPVWKVPAVLETLTGLQLTQGAITQAVSEPVEGMPCAGPEAK
jgi:hypothetical protein